jgi:hypothetical protein
VLILTLPFAFAIGAFLGWGRATRRLYRRPGSTISGDNLSREEMSRRLLARRKRQRWFKAAEFGVYASMIDVAAFYVLMRFAG